MKPEDSPALTKRHADYPIRFGDRVPKAVQMEENIVSDLFAITLDPKDASLRATRGQVYPCWVNGHGAVSVILPDGRLLGVKPGEFTVTEWHT